MVNAVLGGFQLQAAAESLVSAISATNKFLQDAAPWAMKDESQAADRQAITRTCLEAVFILGHFLQPFAPESK